MINQKKAFTLAELVIVITIIVTLTSVSFVSYMWNLVDSRNATRLSELGNIKISLKNHKINNANYPLPWASFDITQWSNIVAKQWLLNDDVYTTEIVSKPKDPYVTQRYYTYSVSANRLSFQLWSIIENEEVSWNDLGLLALIDGDYQTKSVWVLPSLIVAAGANTDVSGANSGSFIVHKSTLNLPYDLEWNPYKSATTLSQVLSQANVEIPKFFWYTSCQEIVDNGAFFGTGRYQITDANSANGTVICAQCNGATTASTWSFANNVCN